MSRFLFEEVALRGHAGKFGHAAQGQLAPAAAGVGGAEGSGERECLLAERRKVMLQTAQAVLPLKFELPDLGLQTCQGLGQGTCGVL